jgi:hypothetical protein
VKIDLTLVPGTAAEQRAAVAQVRRVGAEPLAIVPEGRRWTLYVLGTPVGSGSRSAARSAAHTIGRYRLDLGDFTHTYTAGYGSD